jgi:hypothetical protein
MKSSGLVGLAAGLALLALPTSAMAQDHGRWGGGGAAQAGGGWRGNAAGAGAQAGGAVQGGATQGGGGWRGRGGDAGVRGGGAVQGGSPWRGGDAGVRGGGWRGGTPQTQGRVENQAPAQPQVGVEGRSWRGNGNWRNGTDSQWRNRSYVDPNRNGTYRDPSRDAMRGRDDAARWRGNDAWRGGNDRWRGGNDNGWRQNFRSWNRDWRGDSRYNWRGYRDSHRGIYRLNPYYAPYRDWSYRRLGVGFYLAPLFFGSSYWIDDPMYYRLPPADGPYRWVRYYDDALLVDIYSGEVVDAIYDFFW